uniref:Uncharacterized protein n=1 Tax=Utricularia reniformis TaxID=192314 RepID=A0A1Y0B3E2_9LAMI|nr:hypothetical protein AEK19_MT1743 [Utricularia reniformis]ART31920.1 hypothetical protein AEK19_MT1743 [Utricularia reniformis]
MCTTYVIMTSPWSLIKYIRKNNTFITVIINQIENQDCSTVPSNVSGDYNNSGPLSNRCFFIQDREQDNFK